MKIELPIEKDEEFMKKVKNLVLDTMKGILRVEDDTNELISVAFRKYMDKNDVDMMKIFKECVKEIITDSFYEKRTYGGTRHDASFSKFIKEFITKEIKLQLFNKISNIDIVMNDKEEK